MANRLYGRGKSKSFLISVFVLIFVLITSATLGLRLCAFTASAKNADKTILVSESEKSGNTHSSTTGKGLLIINVNGDEKKVTAPGRVNKYVFNVVNTESFALKYESTASSEFTNTKGLEIPIEVRMLDHNGNYCVGDESTWVPAEEMNYFSKDSVLAANSYEQYTLEWRWPYESGNDENDTNIGVAAIKHNITLRVHVEVSAEKAKPGEAENGGGEPYTGDNSNMTLWLIVASISLVALFILLIFGGKERSDDEKEQEIKAS